MAARPEHARSIDGTISRVVAAPADALFRTLTDIEGLPAWNDKMTHVVEQPPAPGLLISRAFSVKSGSAFRLYPGLHPSQTTGAPVASPRETRSGLS